jgi:hypothetical protein
MAVSVVQLGIVFRSSDQKYIAMHHPHMRDQAIQNGITTRIIGIQYCLGRTKNQDDAPTTWNDRCSYCRTSLKRGDTCVYCFIEYKAKKKFSGVKL